jgi:hypothetical protein
MFIPRLTIVTVALYVGLAVNVPGQAQAQSNSSSLSNKVENGFSPPRTDIPVPENREGGATRGSELASEELSCGAFNMQLFAVEKNRQSPCRHDSLAPNKLAPNELSPQELAPKPSTPSPTDLTNW